MEVEMFTVQKVRINKHVRVTCHVEKNIIIIHDTSDDDKEYGIEMSHEEVELLIPILQNFIEKGDLKT